MVSLLKILLADGPNPTVLPKSSGISLNQSETLLPNSTSTIPQGFANIMNILFISIGALSVLMIVVGGLLFVLSNGDPARTKRARETITYAITGVIIALSGYAIITFITKFLG